ncbi:MAG: hypothetical protein ACOC0P_06015, partial [Planctomycetota bacterium]
MNDTKNWTKDPRLEATPAAAVQTMRMLYAGVIAALTALGTVIGFILVSTGASGSGLVQMPIPFIGIGASIMVFAALIVAPILRVKAWGTLVGNAEVPLPAQVNAYGNGALLYGVIFAVSGLFGVFAALFDGMIFLVLPVVAIVGVLIGWPRRSHFREPAS